MVDNQKKFGLLFPGQGSQYPGMGKSLYENFIQAREIFDQAGRTLGFDLKQKIFSGTEEELKQTQITQPAIFTVSCAAFAVFSGLAPELRKMTAFVAGHSLGEYSALYAAKVFDFQTALKLVEYRGKFIQECCDQHPGTMAAVLGVPKNELGSLCAEVQMDHGTCTMVNFNSSQQIVVAGAKTAVETLTQKISARAGARAIPLNVSGAFHSELMNEASKKMEEVLGKVQPRDAELPVITNVDAQPTIAGDELSRKLAQQVNHPVQWEDTITRMISHGVETFVEVGPGKVLAGILRKIDRKKQVWNVEDEPSLQKALKELPIFSAQQS